MFRNYLAAALRNMVRNRLYAAINILGLSIGFAAAIFAGLYVRNEFTYERWIPGHERVYAVTSIYAQRGTPQEYVLAYRDVAALLTLRAPQVEAVARMRNQSGTLHVGDLHEFNSFGEFTDAVDPDVFKVLPFHAIAGDLATALDQSDGIVLTRAMARKYFGEDEPLGRTISLDDHTLKVTAVIEDWPSNTHFNENAFISARAPFSSLRIWDEERFTPATRPYDMTSRLYVRLKPGASAAAVEAALNDIAVTAIPTALFGPMRMRLIPLDDLRFADIESESARRARASLTEAIDAIGLSGALILFAAGINFVNVMTARASRRAAEVGVRKVSGAARVQLMAQFIGEAIVFAAAGMVLALALVAGLMPPFRALLDLPIKVDVVGDPALVLTLMSAVVVTGVLAGAYPAFILSGLRPAAVLKSGGVRTEGSNLLRGVLVAIQFAILIGFGVVSVVLYRQTAYSLHEGIRYDTDHLLVLDSACTEAMQNSIRALPGVSGVACSYGGIDGGYSARIIGPDGVEHGSADFTFNPVGYDILAVFNLKPLAGRFFLRDRGEDVPPSGGRSNPSVVINEAAVKALGFASPAAAIGQIVRWQRLLPSRAPIDSMPLMPSTVIGVVADFPYMVSSFRVLPHVFYVDPAMSMPYTDAANGTQHWDGRFFVRLKDTDIQQTLATIDGIWKRIGDSKRPILRQFMSEELERNTRTLMRRGKATAIFTLVAIFIACLGLFGLAAFTAEQRTKEIGIRKAMGARSGEILRLLLWQFSQPVLWANLIAWPVAYFAMRRWLQGFAYHIDLSPWTFLAASALALFIALATVIGHALLVARAQPVTALRYE